MLLAGPGLLGALDVSTRRGEVASRPPILRVQCPAAPVSAPQRPNIRKSIAICHALGDFRSGGHGAGPQDFNLGDFVTASVDGGNIPILAVRVEL